jgi:hypothetical protein
MTYETNSAVNSLAEIRLKEKKQKEIERNEYARKILLRCMEYYNEHYPKSLKGKKYTSQKIKLDLKNESLHEFLNRLTEKELTIIYDIFDYYSGEIGLSNVRDYEKKQYVLGQVSKLIPGGAYIKKMRALEAKMREDNLELDQYKKRLANDRKEFEKKFLDVPEVIPEEAKEETFVCRVCGKVCGNGGGLSSHMKTHEG